MRTASADILFLEEGKEEPERIATVIYPIYGQDRNGDIFDAAGIEHIGYCLEMDKKKEGLKGKVITSYRSDHFNAMTLELNESVENASLSEETQELLSDIEMMFQSKKGATSALPSSQERWNDLVVLLYSNDGKVKMADIGKFIPRPGGDYDPYSRK